MGRQGRGGGERASAAKLMGGSNLNTIRVVG